MCSNDYLGLANDQQILDSVRSAAKTWGHGTASGRVLCGTMEIHRDLEAKISEFLGTEDTALYTSCFDANAGLFECLFDEQDTIISDALNHASIIDGTRLCKARRYVFEHADMDDLEAKLKAASDARFRAIITDGVFSMEGTVADLKSICDLAEKYDALVVVDDAHGTGVLGDHGRGTPSLLGVKDRVDIITSTLGKALGGATGGFSSGRKEIVEALRQFSRAYIFTNSIPPTTVLGATTALEMLKRSTTRVDQLRTNTLFFREAMIQAKFDIGPGMHPIVPVIIGDETKAGEMARRLFDLGIFVTSLAFPIVAHGSARIRAQVSAAHSLDDLECVASLIENVWKRMA